MVKKALSKSDINKLIDRLIDKGAPLKKEIKEWTNIQLRISTSMLQEIDAVVKTRVGITRTGWILETLHERLDKLEEY